jgi:hypothetical protein
MIKKMSIKIPKKVVPTQKSIFACLHGDYVGEMFIYIDKKDDNYLFLSMPKNINRIIPIKSFNSGMNLGILEFVEVTLKEIYDIAKAQFIYNETNENTNN